MISTIFFLILTNIYVPNTIIINEAGIKFDLPNDSWKSTEPIRNGGLLIHYYWRDGMKNEFKPGISVIIEDIKSEITPIQYSEIKLNEVEFQIDEKGAKINKNLNAKDIVEYKASYTDKFGRHTTYLLYSIYGDKGIRIYFDSLSEDFDIVDQEFISTIKSIKNNNIDQ